MSKGDWKETAKNLLRAEIKRRGLTVKDVCDRLTEHGEGMSPGSFNNKISRGGFSAAWMLQVFGVLGSKVIRISE